MAAAPVLVRQPHVHQHDLGVEGGDLSERARGIARLAHHLNLGILLKNRAQPGSHYMMSSCIECNTLKTNRTPQEAGMRLIRKPKRPKWHPFVQINFTLHQHDSWRRFIDLAYWNVELGEDV
jgi:5-methylcytosine-specific restriction endonuclease McrA